MRLFRVDLEVTHLDLRFGPRQAQLAFENIWIVILVSERHRFFARMRHGRAERKSHRLIRRNSHASSQAENRIEHGAGRVRQRTIFHDRDRITRCSPTSEETAAIGFILHRADQFTFGNDDVNAPDWFVFGRTPAVREDGVLTGEEFRLDEEIAERLVCSVSVGCVEHDSA